MTWTAEQREEERYFANRDSDLEAPPPIDKRPILPHTPGQSEGQWLVENFVADPAGELATIFEACEQNRKDACEVGRAVLSIWSDFDRMGGES